MTEDRGMGRGLAAILPSSGNGSAELRELPVELIRPNPRQPRTRFDEEGLRALVESIGASGIVQPLLVRPLADGSYELVAGERRWRAARLNGWPSLLAIEHDGDAEVAALLENLQRVDLTPLRRHAP